MISSERADKNVGENLVDTMLGKDSGFYNTKMREGVVNLGGIT